MKKCVLYSTNRTFPGALKPSTGCDAPGRRARSRRRDGGDLARLRRRLVSESGYIHREEALTIDVLDRVVRSAGFLAGGVLECNLAHRRSVAELCMIFKIKSNPMHPISDALPLLYVPELLLLIGTRSRLRVVGLLSITEALCPSLCLFGTILVTLCLMVWDWRVSRAEPMLSCWHDLFFLFCLLLFYLFVPSMGWLCGLGSLD